MLFLTNTLSGKKERFKSSKDGKVLMYVCGITPYDFAHIGHGRCYVTFDFLYRILTFLGYDVSYARNLTDIDDKILMRAKKELGDVTKYPEITKKYIDAFHQDFVQMNCKKPSYEPRVTKMVPEIITFIEQLIDKGCAYEHDGSVYFKVDSFVEYGKLSKQNIAELRSGARVEVVQGKQDPLDFALWKRDDEVGFESPWGHGRPAWHIECSVMAQELFKGTVDIHGGGMDLIFPHHENEIAQSESLYSYPFVNYWVHNAFVQLNKEKMSKSLGNFFTLRDVFEKFDPMVVRFYFLKHHYKNPLDFSFDDLQAAQTAYKKLIKFFQDVCIKSVHDVEQVRQNYVVQAMLDCLLDDVNSSGAIGVLFEKLPILQGDDHAKALVKYFLVELFGLTLDPLPEVQVAITPQIQAMIDERVQARAAKDWKRADELRDQLEQLGVSVQDKKLK